MDAAPFFIGSVRLNHFFLEFKLSLFLEYDCVCGRGLLFLSGDDGYEE